MIYLLVLLLVLFLEFSCSLEVLVLVLQSYSAVVYQVVAVTISATIPH